MPDPYDRFNFATMGESHGVGTGAAGFGGAAAGLTAGAAGAAAAGCAGAAGTTGFAAAGFGSPSGGELGDLMSSGIVVQAQPYGSVCIEKNVNFYQLEKAKSTRPRSWTLRKNSGCITALSVCHPEQVGASAANDNAVEGPLSRFGSRPSLQGVPATTDKNQSTQLAHLTDAPAPDTARSGRECVAHPPCGVRGW